MTKPKAPHLSDEQIARMRLELDEEFSVGLRARRSPSRIHGKWEDEWLLLAMDAIETQIMRAEVDIRRLIAIRNSLSTVRNALASRSSDLRRFSAAIDHQTKPRAPRRKKVA